MNTVEVLEVIKGFLEGAATGIKLQKDSQDNVLAYELVNPCVVIGWLPPKGYLPEGIETSIPCMVVGLEDGADTGEHTQLQIKISFAVYSPGEHTEGGYTPNFNGYIDLLNFMDYVKAQFIKHTIIENKVKVSDEITWGMYDEQPYPYWYGYMKLSVTGMPYPKVEIEKLLN